MIELFKKQLKKNTRYSNYKFNEVWNILEIPYSNIDKHNVLVDNRFILLSPYGDRLKKEFNRLVTICTYNISEKTFEVFDVLKGLEIVNHNIIPVEPLLQHVDFTNEIKGKTPFEYYPELEALSLRIRKKTLVKCAKHLWCKQTQYSLWIKKI